MTREEAIKWFKASPFMHKDHVPFQMAIEALENENALLDCVLEIIDGELIAHAPDYHHIGRGVETRETLERIRSEVEELKGGDAE